MANFCQQVLKPLGSYTCVLLYSTLEPQYNKPLHNTVLIGITNDFLPGQGGYFRNFWVGMCCWDPGNLNLYQSCSSAKFCYPILE